MDQKNHSALESVSQPKYCTGQGQERRAEWASCGMAGVLGSGTGIVYQRAGQGSWQGV